MKSVTNASSKGYLDALSKHKLIAAVQKQNYLNSMSTSNNEIRSNLMINRTISPNPNLSLVKKLVAKRKDRYSDQKPSDSPQKQFNSAMKFSTTAESKSNVS